MSDTAEDDGAHLLGDAGITKRQKLLCTLTYCVAFVGLAMTSESIGPSLPSLAKRLHLTSTALASPALIGRGLGYSIGTLAMGAYIERFQRYSHAMLSVCAILMALCNVLVPQSSTVLLLGVVLAGRGLFNGLNMLVQQLTLTKHVVLSMLT